MIIENRSSGILLHITSLPSAYGIGDLGPEAYKFADLLDEAGQRFWQILPLNPTETGMGNSPYSSHSAFAFNPLLLSPDLLFKDGLLEKKDLKPNYTFRNDRVDFEAVTAFKKAICTKAYINYRRKDNFKMQQAFEYFREQHQSWLQDYSYYVAFRNYFNGKNWLEWDKSIKNRKEKELKKLAEKLEEEIEREQFLQFLFHRQWEQLQDYCNKRDIHFIGDMPFYVSHDSADVWANPKDFKLDKEGRPTSVSGVPPDFFSETGQLWGTPVYNWKELARNNFDWWMRRIDHNLRLFRLLRLDHFRAFSAYWEVPAGDDTAINGKWVKSPGHELLSLIMKYHPEKPIIAEDLGDIDQPVRELIHAFNLPGMVVLLFAFESNDIAFESSFLPHNHVKNSVVYTGTHDNSTTCAWFQNATPATKQIFSDYTNQKITKNNAHEVMLRLAYASVSQLAIVPMQDVLGLGAEATFNKPSTIDGNWEWRLKPGQFTKAHAKKLYKLVKLYGRLR
ncbi:4-alpha-glucanotransferase [Pontibacter vulgaris]|uniref:4-alpha-glucanotransferase n=1 Tax=Pontibacter vulgaris TaxID=2905679 RepID=UPI001FA812B7|nr:4-alpha-glucanotransferase [Pontibacter vulgaris]